MKKFSLRALARWMTAGAAQQLTLIRQYKYRDDKEGKAKARYYHEATAAVLAFHRHGHDPGWLVDRAVSLDALADQADSKERRARLRSNATGLRSYAKHFGKRDFEVLETLSLPLDHENVRVGASPDLHVREKGIEKLVKLDFGVKEPSEREITIMTHGMFEAAHRAGRKLPGSAVLYFDVRRGKELRGAKMGTRLQKDIAAACKFITAVWDSI